MAHRKHRGKSYLSIKRSATACFNCGTPLKSPLERSLRLCNRCEVALTSQRRITYDEAQLMGLDSSVE